MFALVLLLSMNPGDVAAASAWERVGRVDGVTMYKRSHADDAITETMAVGIIDAPPWVVRNAVDDADAAVKMPYIAETKVLRRDHDGSLVVYNRTSAPLVQDRDYTLKVVYETQTNDDGQAVYVSRFRTANDLGPPERSGVVRVHKTTGYWRFEPVGDGSRTRALYCVTTDPGGDVPRALADWGSRQALVEVYGAVRDRVKDRKYHTEEPTLTAGR